MLHNLLKLFNSSGGGFFVQVNNVWYIQGIAVVTKPGGNCTVSKSSIFTDLNDFDSWIRQGISKLYTLPVKYEFSKKHDHHGWDLRWTWKYTKLNIYWGLLVNFIWRVTWLSSKLERSWLYLENRTTLNLFNWRLKIRMSGIFRTTLAVCFLTWKLLLAFDQD